MTCARMQIQEKQVDNSCSEKVRVKAVKRRQGLYGGIVSDGFIAISRENIQHDWRRCALFHFIPGSAISGDITLVIALPFTEAYIFPGSWRDGFRGIQQKDWRVIADKCLEVLLSKNRLLDLGTFGNTARVIRTL